MRRTDAVSKTLRVARKRGTVTRREIAESGLHTQALTRMVREGILERVGSGLYRLPEAPMTENHGLALVAGAVPKAVVCLLSALRFHNVGTQNPPDVWVALDRRTRVPSIGFPPIRVVRFGGAALTEGIETHHIEGVAVRVYDLAKTIVDAFRYRNKIGIDVALEALGDAWRQRRVTMRDLEYYARLTRMRNVMRPYLEALVAT